MRAPTMMITTIMATTDGMKYKSAIDGAAVAAGDAVGAGALAVKNASAEDA